MFLRSSNRIHIIPLTLDGGKGKGLVAHMDFAFSTSPIGDLVSNQPFLYFNPVYLSNPKFLKVSLREKSLLPGLSELIKFSLLLYSIGHFKSHDH